MEISRGQRISLADIGLSDTFFSLVVNLSQKELVIDIACFGLDVAKKLSDERYMIFFNQSVSPCGAVQLMGEARFNIDLARLPAKIDSLILTLAIDGKGVMRQLGQSTVTLNKLDLPVATYSFNGQSFADERAVMLIEFYRKSSQWRVNAVGQGFNGGLDALVKHFGGSVEEPTINSPSKPLAVDQTAAVKSKVSLSKITLEKRGDKVSLEKSSNNSGYGRIVCNLNWVSSSQKNKKSKGIDLDLACLYELTDGTKGVIQALGNLFGSYDSSPYIQLAGDDRTGANTEGEFLYINGDKLKEIKRICIFAFIYDGVVSWTQADGVVTVIVPEHSVIEVRLDNHHNNQQTCAIAMLENSDGKLKLTKLTEYFQGHIALDNHYKWGIKWGKPSRK